MTVVEQRFLGQSGRCRSYQRRRKPSACVAKAVQFIKSLLLETQFGIRIEHGAVAAHDGWEGKVTHGRVAQVQQLAVDAELPRLVGEPVDAEPERPRGRRTRRRPSILTGKAAMSGERASSTPAAESRGPISSSTGTIAFGDEIVHLAEVVLAFQRPAVQLGGSIDRYHLVTSFVDATLRC